MKIQEKIKLLLTALFYIYFSALTGNRSFLRISGFIIENKLWNFKVRLGFENGALYQETSIEGISDSYLARKIFEVKNLDKQCGYDIIVL